MELIEKLNLSRWVISSHMKTSELNISRDYTNIDKKIKEEIKKSVGFLEEALRNE